MEPGRVPPPDVYGHVRFGAWLLVLLQCVAARQCAVWSLLVPCRLPGVYGSVRFGVWVLVPCCPQIFLLSTVHAGVNVCIFSPDFEILYMFL